VIVLDSNQLEYTSPPGGPLLGILRHIANQTGHTLELPEVALEEHLAHRRHAIEAAVLLVENDYRALKRLVPHWPYPLPAMGGLQRSVHHMR
jgi:hypothetical protein